MRSVVLQEPNASSLWYESKSVEAVKLDVGSDSALPCLASELICACIGVQIARCNGKWRVVWELASRAKASPKLCVSVKDLLHMMQAPTHDEYWSLASLLCSRLYFPRSYHRALGQARKSLIGFNTDNIWYSVPRRSPCGLKKLTSGNSLEARRLESSDQWLKPASC